MLALMQRSHPFWPMIVFVVLALLILTVSAVVAKGSATPETTAEAFARTIRVGDVGLAKGFFEPSQWRSGPPEWVGGDDAYFRYESGYEPNLAFLLGQPFDIGPARELKRLHSEMCMVPMFCSESADTIVVLTFDPARYSPWFLPTPLAFIGYGPMTEQELQVFAANPALNAPDRFSLRLRPSLDPDLIAPPPLKAISPPPAPPGAQPITRKFYMVDETRVGFTPRATNRNVVQTDEDPMTPEQIKAHLPRLKAITLRLYLSRHNQFDPWRISFFSFQNAILDTRGKTVMVPLDTQQY